MAGLLMIVFITAVRHPLNSASYTRVGRLLDATLHSVTRQTDPDFRVIVVHNELPRLEIEDPRISFLQVGFPPPSAERRARIDFTAGVRDKGTKLVVGVAAARELGADHVMFIDCDDLMHHELAHHANQRVGDAGWYSPDGFIHTAGSASVQRVVGDFHHRNGSTTILRPDLARIPESISPSSTQQAIMDQLGEDYIVGLIGIHGKWSDFLSLSDERLEPLPFPSTIWEIGTGENASGNLVSSRPKIKIGPDITDAFGLARPPLLVSQLRKAEVASRRVGRRVHRLATSAGRQA